MRGSYIPIAVAVMVLTSVVVFGSSAYTAATLDRSGNIDVVKDANGLIGLQPGSSNQVVNDASGELVIDFARDDGSGVNTNANFTVGNQSAPTSTYAFTVSNNAGKDHDFDLSYDGFNTSDSDDNLQFRIYDDAGAFQTELNQSTTSATVTIPQSKTYYVVIIVNTGDGVGVLTPSADLSGTFTVSV